METVSDNTEVLLPDALFEELIVESDLAEVQSIETEIPEMQSEPETETDTQVSQIETQAPDADISQMPDMGEELITDGDILLSPDVTENMDNSYNTGGAPVQDIPVFPSDSGNGMDNDSSGLYYVLSDGRVVTADELTALSESGDLITDIPQTNDLAIIGVCLTDEQKENYLAYVQSKDEIEKSWREDVLTELSQLKESQISSQENLVSGIEILAENQKEQFYALKLSNMLVFTNMLILFVLAGFYAAGSFWHRFH